jgi:hypothetical protein
MTYFYDVKVSGETRSLSADTDEAAILKVQEIEQDVYLIGISMIYSKEDGIYRTIWME